MKLGPNIYRPILPFHISFQESRSIKYFGLVDSGADFTYIAGELAPLIGIKNIKSGREGAVTGIGGKAKVYFHPVTINIGGHDFDIEAGFTTDATITSFGCGLLGQVGLFDYCTIKFSRRKFEMEINLVSEGLVRRKNR
ncbi:MAG: retropepsin-like aspartic protease [Parcubacteria group bacterium]